MKMVKRSTCYLAIYLSVLLLGLDSCTSQSCLEETETFVKATFYKTGSSTATATDSITVFGIGREDDRLYDRAANITRIKLPLDASSETCGFFIKINGNTDTLRLTYSTYPHLISKECGISFFHVLDSYSVSGSAIDTIMIKNSNITTSNEENIAIFF